MASRPIITCTICGETGPGSSKTKCRRCVDYIRRREQSDNRRKLLQAVDPQLVTAIEQEIARGTPTRRIMDVHDIAYGVVKSVRDTMDEDLAS